MSEVIYIRLKNPEVHQTIERLFTNQPTRGSGSPAQDWYRTLICLGALGPELDAPALELWHAAQRIAEMRKGSMHDDASAKGRVLQEFVQFDQCLMLKPAVVMVLNRLSNVLYYAVYQYAQDYDIRDFLEVVAYACGKARMPISVAMRVAAAKYLERSMRDVKDVLAEEEAMLRVYEHFSKLVP